MAAPAFVCEEDVPVFFPKLFFEYNRNPRPKSESALRKRTPEIVSKLQARAIRYSRFFLGRFVRGSNCWRFLKDHSMFEHLVLAISYQSLHHFIKKKQKKHKIPTQTFLKPLNMLYAVYILRHFRRIGAKKTPTSGNINTFLSRWIFRLSLSSENPPKANTSHPCCSRYLRSADQKNLRLFDKAKKQMLFSDLEIRITNFLVAV